MITSDVLLDAKIRTEEIAKELSSEDVAFLVSLLNEQQDKLRYPAFLILKERSRYKDDVYPYWDVLLEKMSSDNSYQRSIGIILIGENVRWDKADRFSGIAVQYLSHCRDEKFITCRQTIQSITSWIAMRPQLIQSVWDELSAIDIESLKDTQKKLILLDILDVFLAVLKIKDHVGIEDYISRALTGGLLDKKAAKDIENCLSKLALSQGKTRGGA